MKDGHDARRRRNKFSSLIQRNFDSNWHDMQGRYDLISSDGADGFLVQENAIYNGASAAPHLKATITNKLACSDLLWI
jgi:hypothetical protein